MGTTITVEIVGHDATAVDRAERARAAARALAWFGDIEATCSRFDPSSELRRLCDQPGRATPVSATVLEALRFAIALAHETNGGFDPTVGHLMVRHGFDRHYYTGESSRVSPADGEGDFRDVEIDVDNRTVTLHRPVQLDLGAVAKGLAVDMAVRELISYKNFAVNAGGDLFLAGRNPQRKPWSVGIRHPREPDKTIETIHVSDIAVCTSGDYERPRPTGDGHHIVDPRSGESPSELASVTVVAPLAMVADALATAAFVLGAERGRSLLTKHGAEGLFITSHLERSATAGFPRD